jgi:hypothetical protein
MQVLCSYYSSEYALQNEGYILQNYPIYTIRSDNANNITIKYLEVLKVSSKCVISRRNSFFQ